jgi:hypothetical protein
VGDAVIGFEAGFGCQITDLIKAELALGSANAAYFDGSGLWIKPKVGFSFSPNLEFALFDKISNIGADGDLDPDLNVKNQFQIEIVWKF